MSDGMRRPPRLWEQKLEAKIKASGIGAGATSGGTSPIVGAPAPGPGGPGESLEPVPVVDPDPSTPRLPNTPIVSGSTLGLTVVWTGTDADGDVFPVGTIVEVHASTSTGFTPDSSTLQGVITEPGGSLLIGDLTAGLTYFVKLVSVAPDGTVLETSAQASAQVGLVQGSEIAGDAVITQIVSATQPATSFADGSIWLNTSNGSYYTLTGGAWVQRQWDTAAIAANAITANQIAAQAITSKFLTGEIIRTGSSPSARVEISAANGIQVFRDATNTTFWAKPTGEVVFGSASVNASGTTVVNGNSITTGTVSGDRISGGTIQGSTIVTRADGYRVRLKDGGAGGTDHLEFLSGSTVRGRVFATDLLFGIEAPQDVALYNISGSPTFANLQVNNFSAAGTSSFSAQASFNGQVVSANIDDNPQAGNPEVGINTTSDRLRRIGSSQNIKYDITTLSGELSESVDDERQADVVTVNPADLLNVAVVEFSAIDDGEPSTRRLVGFIAEDMADKYPLGATRDANGTPIGIETQGVVASLVAIVQQQQQTIDNLTTRIEALEA